MTVEEMKHENQQQQDDDNDSNNKRLKSDPVATPLIHNYIAGTKVPASDGHAIPVTNPATGAVIAHVVSSPPSDVEAVVQSAHEALAAWSSTTIKARAAIILKLHGLIRDHTDELAQLIVAENGKNYTEAVADVAKANETVEYAASLPQLAAGQTLMVSGASAGFASGVTCQEKRVPVGVVVSIVPFNFPIMVPCWTLPIALVMGNTVILKPSEKVPMTTYRLVDLLEQAGIPPGVVTLLQTNQPATIQALIQHPLVKAVTFVGSSPVAKLIATTCRSLHKRCTALGGAKNHLIALVQDCHLESTAADIVVSFAGCAGQRCMAASVLLLTPTTTPTTTEGEEESSSRLSKQLLDLVVSKAAAIQPGTGPGQMGPVIDPASLQKIVSYIQDAVDNCQVEILLDGRTWMTNPELSSTGGNWIGPTILLHKSSQDKAMREEVFGPVLSVYQCKSWEEAIDIENNNTPFGNAACIYTTNGGHAEWFLERFRAGMLGCNVGIPVPREPFSFGGLHGTVSKYGDMDITGDGGMEFFSNRIKITSRWPMTTERPANLHRDDPTTTNGAPSTANTGTATETTDLASFAGRM